MTEELGSKLRSLIQKVFEEMERNLMAKWELVCDGPEGAVVAEIEWKIEEDVGYRAY